jgi:hypothetical protein
MSRVRRLYEKDGPSAFNPEAHLRRSGEAPTSPLFILAKDLQTKMKVKDSRFHLRLTLADNR